MIVIKNSVVKKQPNFWNACVFHPTDAIEDPWGRCILDQMAEDKAIHTVRVYTMFEDIVYRNAAGELSFDFRLSDLRLDYLLSRGYTPMLAYAGIPDCIASSTAHMTTVCKNKTRYKGKMWNSSAPADYALWEEICYRYTKHNVERYGVETVSGWKCHCFNEPDVPGFFLSQYPIEQYAERLAEYCKLYHAFQNGVRRVSKEILIGGPALALSHQFLGGFLDYVRENQLKLDFISLHNYGTTPGELSRGEDQYSVNGFMKHQRAYVETITQHGFADTPVVVDEWGMATGGFCNRDDYPELMARETEIFSAYYVKLIHQIVHSDLRMELLSICLSGQHEMVEDFSGFRNFFTLHFFKKTIYNAHILAARLYEDLLETKNDAENVFVIPTEQDGRYAVLLTYASEHFSENLPTIQQSITFEANVSGKKATVYCIDKDTTNPYRLYQREGMTELRADDIARLREEGNLKPVQQFVMADKIALTLTANATYLITLE